MTKKRIAVVGAGISGLTCAYELQKAGFDVTVFEKRDFVGGRMSTRTKDGLPFDLGANHLCNLYREMKKYCNEFGIGWEKMTFSNYGIYKDGKVVPLMQAASIWSRFTFFLRQLGKRRVHDFFDLSNAAFLDTESGEDFGKKMAADDINDFLVDGFTSTYQFHRAHEISSGAFIAIMESIGRDGNGWNLYHLPGGMSVLPEAFAARLPVKLSSPITSVEVKNGAIEVIVGDQQEMYDAVVLASTAPATLQFYRNPTPAQKDLLEKSLYATSISVALRFSKEALPPQSVVWTPYIQSPKISGYTNELMKGTDVVKDGESMLCVWLHEDFAKTLINKSDEEIFAAVIPELKKVAPWIKVDTRITPHDIERWTEAMPKFSYGHLTRVKDFLSEHQGDQNVYFCGDFMNSLWTEGSIRGGQRTAALISRKLGTS
jgi:oxygen-dependent protoporphyrinogen oxidase